MKTCKKIIAVALVLMLAMAVMAPSAFAADYPSKGIYAINPWGAGGGTDNCLRAFCAALEKQLGQTITVDNLTGASGVIGHEAIADADPDGYTIGMITWELSSYVPQDMSEYTYENYIPICRVNTDAAAITVNTKWAADNNVTDLDSFVAYCKDHPGEVTMGGSSSGSGGVVGAVILWLIIIFIIVFAVVKNKKNNARMALLPLRRPLPRARSPVSPSPLPRPAPSSNPAT